MGPVQVILFPTDFSEYSDAAFHFACSLAGHYRAKLCIVSVSEPAFSVGDMIMPMPQTEAEHKQLEDKLATVQPSNPSFAVEHELVSGRPADEILQASERLGADIIVMGTHGRGGLSRALMGSVAAEVVRKAPCPVLTVKLPKPKPIGARVRRRSNKQPISS